MQTWYYEVVSIDGDYANLRRIDIPSDDLKLVARALLPAGIYDGCKLKYDLLKIRVAYLARGGNFSPSATNRPLWTNRPLG